MSKLVRAEYKPPVYFINKVDLVFEIPDSHDEVTIVTGIMQYKLNELYTVGAPLILNAEDADLENVSINGVNVDLSSITVTKDDDSQLLAIADVPVEGTLVIKNRLKPWRNDSCAGLYGSNGALFTQCEAIAFRKIIPYIDRPDNLAVFICEIQAKEQEFPVLLSNGNLIAAGKLANGRHFAKYEDPFPKPSYLFAIVAADLGCIKDHYFTKSGRRINLFVHVKAELAGKAVMAMQALKESMKWDEDNYDLEYDLDNCHMVGASGFNAGAMENKGLIIFNDLSLLVDSQSSTDSKQLNVWDTVSHEYFHNYAGNRVTVRSWEELALKEGLATRKETDFMMDKFGHAVYRINELSSLCVDQFAEDAGPTAHAVRPDEVDSIDNIYTDTIYTKGAELLAMLSRMLGRYTFTEGVKHYFKKFDGQAVTIEDFISAQEHVSGRNLQQFLRWYTTPGTPKLEFSEEYNSETLTYSLHVKQSLINASGEVMPPMHIPIAVNLLDSNGADILAENKMLELTTFEATFTFDMITENPTPSLLRDFSAPVIVTKSPITDEQKLFLFHYDRDPVNRYLMGQEIMRAYILEMYTNISDLINFSAIENLDLSSMRIPDKFVSTIEHLVAELYEVDKGLLALLLSVPSLDEILPALENIDLDALILAHNWFKQTFAANFDWEIMYERTNTLGNNDLTAELMGQRSLHNLSLQYLIQSDVDECVEYCIKQFYSAINMTESIGALKVLASQNGGLFVKQELVVFYERWKHDSQAIDSWMRIQAASNAADTIDKLRALMQHESFDIKVPNHVYAVVRYFGTCNLEQFHRADGEGYKFVIDAVIQIDPINPGLASRVMLSLFNDWQKFDANRQTLMLAELRRLDFIEELSAGTKDLVTKKLANAPTLESAAIPSAAINTLTLDVGESGASLFFRSPSSSSSHDSVEEGIGSETHSLSSHDLEANSESQTLLKFKG